MKKTILISHLGQLVFEGKLINIPMKEKSIIEKSILVFDDDDPCIIHKSYINKIFVDEILDMFTKEESTIISGDKFESELDFIDLPNIKELILELKG